MPTCPTAVFAAAPAVLAVLLAASPLPADHHIQRYARFQVDGRVVYGIVEGDRIRELDGDLFASPEPTDRTHGLSEVKLLAPTQPTKVLGAAANYRNPDSPPAPDARPELFFKTPSCIIREGEPIVIPPGDPGVVHESEVVVVIGRRCSKITADRAGDYIFGVTVGNDVTAANWNASDLQFWRGKGSDTFGPCGPFIVTGLDYNNLAMKCYVNDELRTEGHSGRLVFGIDELVAFISQHMTLEPGDLIYAGAAGATPAEPGDTVMVEVEGVGRLTNPVAAAR